MSERAVTVGDMKSVWSGALSEENCFPIFNVSLRQVVKGQTPEETADGEGLQRRRMGKGWARLREMKETVRKMRFQIRHSGLGDSQIGSVWPDFFLPSCQSPRFSVRFLSLKSEVKCVI